MKEYFPDKRSLATIKTVLILAAFGIASIAMYFVPIRILAILISAASMLLSLVLSFIYYPLLFRSMKYTVTDTEVIRSSGVFIKTHQSIRFSAIQYTAAISTPLSKYTGLNFIVFFVYGGQERLLFLKWSDAEEILRKSSGLKNEEV